MNKMKRAYVNSNQSQLVNEESSARLKQQRLLEDYLEVQKEFVSKKKRLQIARQKRDILLAEVRYHLCFLIFAWILYSEKYRIHSKFNNFALPFLLKNSFLRQKYTYLKTQKPELESKQDLGLQNSSARSKLLAEKGNHGFNKASSKNSSPLLVSNLILGDEDWDRKRKEVVVLDPLRVEKKCKNNMITEKRIGKKKISRQDQVALKV